MAHLDRVAFAFPPTSPNLFASQGPAPSSGSATPFISVRKRHAPAFSFPKIFPSKKRTISFSNVRVYGKRKLPQQVIDQHFKRLIGKEVWLEQVKEAVEEVNKWFDANDYVCSRLFLGPIPVVMDSLDLYSLEPLLTDLKLIPVDRDGKETIEGNIKTRKGTICNAIGMHVGDVFVWKASGFARLMALGLFDFANAEVKILSNESVQLTLRLCERSPGRIEPGAGITSDGKVYGDVSIVDNNFMGRAQRLRVEWQKRLDVPRPSGGIAFEDMRIGARVPLSFRLRAYRDCNSTRSLPVGPAVSRVDNGDREGANANIMDRESPLRYEKDRDGILIDLGYRAAESCLLFNFTPMLEHIHPNAVDENGTSSLQTVLQSAVTHATRFTIDCPRAGHMVRVEQYLGTPILTAPDPFYKIVFRAAQYFGLPSKSSIVVGSVLGLGSENLPWHEQRSLGGQPTVRGFTYGELGRHRNYATARVELRVPLPFNLVKYDENDSKVDISNASEDSAAKPVNSPNSAAETTESKEGNMKSQEKRTPTGNMIPSRSPDKMPPLVGVLFADAASVGSKESDVLGTSYGIGLRVGGVISVELTGTGDGRRSRLHFGLVDRSM